MNFSVNITVFILSADGFVAGFVDMELVSWLLLFISRLTDANFDIDEPLLMDRWEFLISDTALTKKKVTEP